MICKECGYDRVPEGARFCPKCRVAISQLGEVKETPVSDTGDSGAIAAADYLEFQVRAWHADANHAQVLVHSSPVGGMREPVVVALDPKVLQGIRQFAAFSPCKGKPGTLAGTVLVGQALSQILLPPAVFTLLVRSLEHIEPGDGLRVRLCLDESLVDLPWEFLYRPDASQTHPLSSFLVLDHRISLVREVPIPRRKLQPSAQKQLMVFVGTLWEGGDDAWGTKKEHQSLAEALTPVESFLSTEFHAASGDQIASALDEPVSIFHYSGHTDSDDGRGYLLREVRDNYPASPKLYSQALAAMLGRAQTRLALFSACNSGRWPFAGPLLKAGLSALVGTQGAVSTRAAMVFAEKLYASLAVGLTLDEAMTWARLHILEAGVSLGEESCEWGSFMAYMPTADATLFPRPHSRAVDEAQEAARRGRHLTIVNVYNKNLDVDIDIETMTGGRVAGISEIIAGAGGR
jgi:hypothetical protein